MIEGTKAGLQIWFNDALVLQGSTTGTQQKMNGAVVVERSIGGKKQVPKVKIQLPGEVALEFMAIIKAGKLTSLNGLVKMRQISGQDGQCGNFNLDPSDDTKE